MSEPQLNEIAQDLKTRRNALLKKAVHGNKTSAKRGVLDRMFSLAFRGFVYPQIWEDPDIDLAALEITPEKRIVTISSGGCNILNYLLADPEKIDAVDLNPAHLALAKLKLAGAKYLDQYNDFFRMFGEADTPLNVQTYDLKLRDHLDAESRAYWDSKAPFLGRRINYFANNVYSYGLLGRFIGTVHWMTKLYGQDLNKLLQAENIQDQRRLFEETISPIFDKKIVRALCKMPVSLYGLGIPPAQFDDLMKSAKGDMAALLKSRVERLACDFPISDNYFAWQAFGRGYDRNFRQALPKYLKPENFATLKQKTDRVQTHLMTMTDYLASQREESIDAFVLLDAQDWMSDAQVTDLWLEILRTARPEARVIFRTAGEESHLPSALPQNLLSLWDYKAEQSLDLTAKDRSSIYGGFHLYVLKS